MLENCAAHALGQRKGALPPHHIFPWSQSRVIQLEFVSRSERVMSYDSDSKIQFIVEQKLNQYPNNVPWHNMWSRGLTLLHPHPPYSSGDASLLLTPITLLTPMFPQYVCLFGAKLVLQLSCWGPALDFYTTGMILTFQLFILNA